MRKESMLNEIRTLRELQDCANIVNFEGAYEFENKFLIVMDYVGEGCLFTHLKKNKLLNEEDARTIMT